LVTTSGFTAAAKRRAGRIQNLELVDGAGLVSRGSDAGLSLHSEDHGYETELTDEEILSVLEGGEPMTTIEVADALGAESRSVLDHLESLVDDDVIRVKRIGDEVGVWYR
jgi:predicted HTH transcriptional regulator